jgi:hypothetical protein
MNRGPLLLTLTIFIGLAAVGVLVLTASVSAPYQAGQESGFEPDGVTVLARRVISIPFGISDRGYLLGDSSILVSGHADCGPGGDWYQIRVNVTQEGTSGQAVGRMEDQCMENGSGSWQVQAAVPPGQSFTAGPARVCAMAVIHYEHQGAVAHQWCRDIMIE